MLSSGDTSRCLGRRVPAWATPVSPTFLLTCSSWPSKCLAMSWISSQGGALQRSLHSAHKSDGGNTTPTAAAAPAASHQPWLGPARLLICGRWPSRRFAASWRSVCALYAGRSDRAPDSCHPTTVTATPRLCATCIGRLGHVSYAPLGTAVA
eukprot:SAG25_NODE_801_length_5268_cov_3.548849_4_plen_152_part_00